VKEILLSQSAKRELLTLSMAKVGWETAVLGWQRLSAATPSVERRDFELMAAPIVILYARPFYENGGLTLLDRYSDFSTSPSPSEFAENHDRLLKARCQLIAHIDVSQSQRLIDGSVGFERTDYLALRCEPDGAFTVKTMCLLPDLVGSLPVAKLLAFQLSRVSSDLVAAGKRILGRRVQLGEWCRLINRDARRAGSE